MIYQVLDDKEDCIALYYNKQIIKSEFSKDLRGTWRYSPAGEFLEEADFAFNVVQGKPISQFLPEYCREYGKKILVQTSNIISSYIKTGVPLNKFCIYDLIPESVLLEFLEIKNIATKYVFDYYSKPRNYEHMVKASKIKQQIKINQLKYDYDISPTFFVKNSLIKKYFELLNNPGIIDYNEYAATTGRFGMNQGGFPILNLPTRLRRMLIPNNDWFIELDYNSADLRTALAVLGVSQPEQDIHQWNIDNVFTKVKTRESAKENVFKWLYSNHKGNKLLQEVYNKEKMLDKYYHDGIIVNDFERAMSCDSYHAVNYLIQSTTNDIFVEQVYEVLKFLKDKKSHIAFTIHDSFVIDLDRSEKHLLPQIKEIFANTRYGKFLTNIKYGKNYYDMEKLNL